MSYISYESVHTVQGGNNDAICTIACDLLIRSMSQQKCWLRVITTLVKRHLTYVFPSAQCTFLPAFKHSICCRTLCPHPAFLSWDLRTNLLDRLFPDNSIPILIHNLPSFPKKLYFYICTSYESNQYFRAGTEIQIETMTYQYLLINTVEEFFPPQSILLNNLLFEIKID